MSKTQKPSVLPKIFKVVAIAVSSILFLGIIGVLFIKFDTPAAAEFTDNVLRPLFGPSKVVALEKLFYNTSDTIHQITHKNSNDQVPEFVDQTNPTNLSNTHLNLISIQSPTGFTAQSGENIWKNRPLSLFPNREVMAYTYVRPDKARPYANVTLVQLDTQVLRLGTVAGTKQPGGPVGMIGPGKVPSGITQSGNLVAAFDGGFQYRDGEYGMIVGDKTYLPLKPDLATLVGYTNGSLKLINYTGQNLGKDIAFVRQNCPMLIDNGEIGIYQEKNKKLWGRTLTAGIYTWRSGLGIDKKGNLIYAVGNSLTPETLAIALKAAGAVNAMQLDINPYWVRFNIFDTNGPGTYKTSTLMKKIQDGSKLYLNGYTKDFFYVYKK